MSTLTDSIDRFLNYLKQNHPTISDSIQPGISKYQIDEIIGFLPFNLSNEVYEFYQKMNGSNYQFFFLEICSLSLEDPLNFYPSYYTTDFIDIHGDPDPYNYMGNPLLPIFHSDRCTLAVICDGDLQQSPVCFSVDCEISILFTNLTSMMQTLVEGLETGAIYLERYDSYASFEADSEKITPIYKKYNSSVPLLISEWIKSSEWINNDNFIARRNSDRFLHQCSLLRKFWSDIKLEQLGDPEAIEIILKTSQGEIDNYAHRNV